MSCYTVEVANNGVIHREDHSDVIKAMTAALKAWNAAEPKESTTVDVYSAGGQTVIHFPRE